MESVLNVYYDTRLAPITFDFGTYLVVANAFRQKLKLDRLYLHLIRQGFRNVTERETAYDYDTKAWRFRHIVLPLANLLPAVSGVSWTSNGPSDLKIPYFPVTYPPRSQAEAKTSIPYLSNSLLKYKGSGIDLRPYASGPQAERLARNLVGGTEKGLVTISLRTSNQQLERNSVLPVWHAVYKTLVGEGYKVLIIPDFEDVTSDRLYSKYDWSVFMPATFDLDIRLALYSIARLNLGVLNGVLVPLFHSRYPYLIFKPNVESVNQTKTEWLRNIFGIEKGQSFWWSQDNQRLTWEVDEDADCVLNEVYKSLDG